MGIQLEQERKAGLPVVKRTALNQKYFGAIVKVEQRDRMKRDETTGAMTAVLKPGGKARQELVLTCLTLPGTTAPVGLGDDEHVPAEGELARLILKGKAFSDWISTKGELGRPVQVGDVVTQETKFAQVYDAQGNPSGAEITNQQAVNDVPRGRSVGIYGPITVRAPKDGSPWVAKAEEAWHSLQEPIAAEPQAANIGADNDDDEPPF
jgi:hypothetical protein